ISGVTERLELARARDSSRFSANHLDSLIGHFMLVLFFAVAALTRSLAWRIQRFARSHRSTTRIVCLEIARGFLVVAVRVGGAVGPVTQACTTACTIGGRWHWHSARSSVLLTFVRALHLGVMCPCGTTLALAPSRRIRSATLTRWNS